MTSTFLHQNTSGGGLHVLRSACSGQGFLFRSSYWQLTAVAVELNACELSHFGCVLT